MAQVAHAHGGSHTLWPSRELCVDIWTFKLHRKSHFKDVTQSTFLACLKTRYPQEVKSQSHLDAIYKKMEENTQYQPELNQITRWKSAEVKKRKTAILGPSN